MLNFQDPLCVHVYAVISQFKYVAGIHKTPPEFNAQEGNKPHSGYHFVLQNEKLKMKVLYAAKYPDLFLSQKICSTLRVRK